MSAKRCVCGTPTSHYSQLRTATETEICQTSLKTLHLPGMHRTGIYVTAVGIGIWNLLSGACKVQGWVGQGCLQMCRWVSMTLLHMHKSISHPKRRSRWLWCHFIMSLSYCWCKLKNHIKGVWHEPQGWFSSTPVQFRSVLVWEGDRLSVPANSVHLKEQEYRHTGMCSLFVHPSCTHPKLAWMPLVSFVELLVHQLSVSSPCDNQT